MKHRPIPELPWEAVSPAPPANACFVRFSTLLLHARSGRREGIFRRTSEVLDRPDLEPFLDEGIRASLEWFNENLHAPDLTRPEAIFYFKSSALTCMAKAWELIHFLREAGVVVEMQIVEYPGRTIYEDAHQIAAIPGARVPVRRIPGHPLGGHARAEGNRPIAPRGRARELPNPRPVHSARGVRD